MEETERGRDGAERRWGQKRRHHKDQYCLPAFRISLIPALTSHTIQASHPMTALPPPALVTQSRGCLLHGEGGDCGGCGTPIAPHHTPAAGG